MADFVYISFAQAATCSYKHTQMHKQMSDKHVYHTLRNTHTCIVRQRARSRALPAARDLWENRTPPVLFIFPSRANTELPSNWSRLRLLSLIQTLIATCLLLFFLMFFFPPTSFFFLPKVPLVAFDLKVQDSMQLLQVTSRFLWEIKMCSVPGTTVVMRPDNPSLGLRLKLDFLPDNVAVVAREECGHQVIDSVYMWWGGEVTISLSLCLHCLSLSPLSPLCHCLAFGQLCIWVQTDW